MEIFLWSILFGIIAGLVWEILYILRAFFGFSAIPTIIIDTLSSLVSGILFILCIFTFNYGIFRLYELIGFICGFVITLFSLGKLVAIVTNFVYNYVTRLSKRLENYRLEKRNAKRKVYKEN